MGRDSKRNSAYSSGLRGGESPRSAHKEPTMKDGATSVSVRRADNGYIVECSYPPKKGKDYLWTPPSQHIFASAAEVAAFIEEKLGVKDEDDKKK